MSLLLVISVLFVFTFSVLVQGSTIAKLFKPDYLKALLK